MEGPRQVQAHVGRQVLAAGEFGPDVGGCSNHDPAAQSGSGLAVGAAAGGVAQLLELEPGPEALPIARTGSRRCRCGPGSPPAWREADQVYLFPGNAPGKPLGDIKTFWRHVCRDAGLEGVRLHDLRHTFASSLVSSGVSLHIDGRLLGHTQPQTTARYAHLDDHALREATNGFGRLMEGAGQGYEAEVVEMQGGAPKPL